MTEKNDETAAAVEEKEEAPSFEGALEELEALVDQLESGDLTLESSLRAFERGVTLTRHCQQALEAAQVKLQALTEEDGAWKLEELSSTLDD